jgi:uncharacterized protein (TIGR03437 family)
VRVTANENANATYTFTANATLTVSDLQILSGSNNQSAAINTPFANPLVVEVRNQGVARSGVTVNFAVTSGSVVLSSNSAVTDNAGRASVTATAGPVPGPAVVTASVGNLSAPFNLTVRLGGPELTLDNFFNAASFARGANALSPCGVALVMAAGLAQGIQGTVVPNSVVGPLPLTLAGVSIQVGNSFSPIYNVSNMNGSESATFQVPCDAPVGNAQVIVRAGGASSTISVPVNAVSPGVFQFLDSDGLRRAVILKPDGTFATAANPARQGEIVRAYVTGIGPGQPAVSTNSPGIPGLQTQAQNPVIVGVNNAGVRVVSATLAENLIGIYEVAFEIPSGTAPGLNAPLGFAVDLNGQLVFANGSAIPIQ